MAGDALKKDDGPRAKPLGGSRDEPRSAYAREVLAHLDGLPPGERLRLDELGDLDRVDR